MHRLGSSSRPLKLSCSGLLDHHVHPTLSKLHTSRLVSQTATQLRDDGKHPNEGNDSKARRGKTQPQPEKGNFKGKFKSFEGAESVSKASAAWGKGTRSDKMPNGRQTQSKITQKPDLLDPVVTEEGHTNTYNLAPGTFVHVCRNEKATAGVLLGQTSFNWVPYYIILRTNGALLFALRNDVVYAIPGVVSVDLAARCGNPEELALKLIENFNSSMPEVNLVPPPNELNARVEVLRRTREMVQKAEMRLGELSNKDVDLYNQFRSADPNKWSKTTLSEVARVFHPKPDFITLYATNQLLIQKSKYFKLDNAYLLTQQISVRPLSEVELIEKVTQWSRLPPGTGPIDSFTEKAKQVMLVKEQVTQASDDTPGQAPALHTWSESDKSIIEFLICSIRMHRSTQSDPFELPKVTIGRRVFPSMPVVETTHIYRLLVDTGVFAPWQDPTVLNPDLDLEAEPPHVLPIEQVKETHNKRGISTPSTVLGPDDFYPADPLESVRHDFGDLPVYVVDAPSAEELDDGVSIEQIPSEPGNFWVHVHIADPTSLIHPGHKLAQYAAKRIETVYFAQSTYPLIPKSVTHSVDRGLSLGSGRAKGQPERVMTFSSKVDLRGNILDYRVRAGIVNNVQVLSYDQINFHLFKRVFQPIRPFEPFSTISETYEPLSKRQEEDMKLLGQVAKGTVENAFGRGLIRSQAFKMFIEGVKLPHGVTSPTLKPSVFKGFLKYDYTVERHDYHDINSGVIISECMQLANRVASRYATEHNLPFIRRCSSDWVLKNEDDLPKLLSLRHQPSGYIHHHDVLPYVKSVPTGEYSVEPKAHNSLKVPEGEGYSRVTSPLRRYSDLVLHWQIQHLLLGSRAPSSKPPFSREFLQGLAVKLKPEESRIRNAQTENINFFGTLYLERWIQETEWLRAQGKEREHDPLRELEAIIDFQVGGASGVDGKLQEYHITVPKLGLAGTLETETESMLETLSVVPVEVSRFEYNPAAKVFFRLRR